MRQRSTTLVLLTLLLGAVCTRVLAAPNRSLGYQLIVHKSNPVSLVERQFVEDAFLKRVTRWSGDRLIIPVDLGPRSTVRQDFSRDVLRRSTAAVRSYWQQLIFAGRDVPPAELDDDEQVLAYVRKHEGSIGYVSADAETGEVKVLSLR